VVGGTFNNVLTSVSDLAKPDGEQQNSGIENIGPRAPAQCGFVAKTAVDEAGRCNNRSVTTVL
jgi:hypothetical protein